MFYLTEMAHTILLSFVVEILIFSALNVCAKKIMFSNTWAVKIRGGNRIILETLARKHGFVNETQVRMRKILIPWKKGPHE